MRAGPAPSQTREIALLAAGAFCISLSPIFVKAIGLGHMGPTAIGFWRLILGAFGFFLIAIVTRRSLKLSPHALLWAALAGLSFSFDIFLWHRSILLTGAGMATILGNTQVFSSAILSYFLFRERLSLRFFIAAVIGLFSVSLLVGIFSQTVVFTPDYTLGVTFGLGTGFAYAGFIVGLKRGSRVEPRPDPIVFMAWSSLVTAVCLGIAAPFEHGLFLPGSLFDWTMLVGLGLIVQVFGWWAISWSLHYIEIHRASLILLLQPTLATVWGAIIFSEHLDLLQILGAVLTLTAIYFGSIRPESSSDSNTIPADHLVQG